MGKRMDFLKEKAMEAKANMEKRAEQAIDWMAQNPELTTVGVAAAGKVLWEVGRAAKRRQVDKLEYDRKRSVYDPSIGSRWTLRRPMTNNENCELQRRIAAGQSRGEALRQMGLLSRR